MDEPIEYEDAVRIAYEVTLEMEPKHPETEAQAVFRSKVTPQVRAIIARGGVVSCPSETAE